MKSLNNPAVETVIDKYISSWGVGEVKSVLINNLSLKPEQVEKIENDLEMIFKNAVKDTSLLLCEMIQEKFNNMIEFDLMGQ